MRLRTVSKSSLSFQGPQPISRALKGNLNIAGSQEAEVVKEEAEDLESET
jgi:hypothetical protein